MISFLNDYSEICHEKIFAHMSACMKEHKPGYGTDTHCENARALIKKAIDAPNADVHFTIAGTPTNALAIHNAIRPYEAVIACDSGHINVHETGAIEATGHKVLTRPHKDGKVTPEMIEDILAEHGDEHMVKPAMVYISQSTEYGSIYSRAELAALREVTKKHDLVLFMDGARIGSALASEKCDMDLPFIAKNTDMFYIGGTKNGAMIGEALIILRDDLKKDFRYLMKNQGNLLAKGFIIGMQFETLFTDNLFFEIAKRANACATRIADALEKKGIKCYVEPASNQLFPLFTEEEAKKISDEFLVTDCGTVDGKRMIRLVTSFATSDEDVDAMVRAIENL